MKTPPRFVAAACVVAAAAAATQACGNSSAPSGPATEIAVASVTTGIGEISSVFPVCRRSGSQAPSPSAELPPDASVWLQQALEFHRNAAAPGGFTGRTLTGVKPADQLGESGGRTTFPVYNHASGVTTGTYAFQNFCTIDNNTGQRVTLNGEIKFTNSGTPTPTGPIMHKIEASSTSGLTEGTRSASGQQVSSRKTTFEDYTYTPGVPGGNPTSSKPDRLVAKSFSITNQVTGKTYRQTDYQMTYFRTSTGGQFAFTGANNSTAVLTVVPCRLLQGTLTVDGQPVTNVPVCK